MPHDLPTLARARSAAADLRRVEKSPGAPRPIDRQSVQRGFDRLELSALVAFARTVLPKDRR